MDPKKSLEFSNKISEQKDQYIDTGGWMCYRQNSPFEGGLRKDLMQLNELSLTQLIELKQAYHKAIVQIENTISRK